jgi:hypothetical protein
LNGIAADISSVAASLAAFRSSPLAAAVPLRDPATVDFAEALAGDFFGGAADLFRFITIARSSGSFCAKRACCPRGEPDPASTCAAAWIPTQRLRGFPQGATKVGQFGRTTPIYVGFITGFWGDADELRDLPEPGFDVDAAAYQEGPASSLDERIMAGPDLR